MSRGFMNRPSSLSKVVPDPKAKKREPRPADDLKPRAFRTAALVLDRKTPNERRYEIDHGGARPPKVYRIRNRARVLVKNQKERQEVIDAFLRSVKKPLKLTPGVIEPIETQEATEP